MPIKFDPNATGKFKYAWATYIPRRNPEFKLHSNRGHALTACLHHGGEFVLYKWENGRWEDKVRWEEPYPTRECYICQKPKGDMWDYYPKRAWINKKDPVPMMVYLCEGHIRCP